MLWIFCLPRINQINQIPFPAELHYSHASMSGFVQQALSIVKTSHKQLWIDSIQKCDNFYNIIIQKFKVFEYNYPQPLAHSNLIDQVLMYDFSRMQKALEVWTWYPNRLYLIPYITILAISSFTETCWKHSKVTLTI